MAITEEIAQQQPPPGRTSLLQQFRELRVGLGDAGWIPLVVLFGLNFVDEFDQVAFAALAPEIRDYFNLSNSAFILVVSLSGAMSILLATPIGYLADRWHRVRISQIAGLVWGFAAIATGLAPAIGWLIAARFLGGVGRLVNEPVHPSLLSDYYQPRILPSVYGVHRFANILGNIAGPVAGILVAVFTLGDPVPDIVAYPGGPLLVGGSWYAPWRPVFVIMAIPTFLLLIGSLRLKEPLRGGTIDANEAVRNTERVGFGEAYRRLRAVESLKRTWVAAFFFGAGVIPLASFLSLFFEDVYQMGPFGRGMMVLVRGAGGAIGLAIGARLANKANSENKPQWLPIITGLMIVEFALGMFAMAIAPWVGLSILFALVLSIGAAGFLPPYLTTVALIAPPKIRSQGYAYSLLFFAIGGIVLSQFASNVGDDHGLRAGMLLLGGLILIGGLVGLTVRNFIRRDMVEAFKSVRAQETADTGSMLVCHGVDVAYDQVQVLFGVDLELNEGEIVALLGTNGAGKSTLLKAISGLVDPAAGAIIFEGRDITHADPNSKSAMGIVQVPGGRGIFPSLSVADNLKAAGWLYRDDAKYREEALDRVMEYFPRLRERWDTPAGNLSGGEQQMLSIAQAFIARPKLLLIDELSLGLAPTIVNQLLGIVRAINENGTTVVLVEQSVNTALKLADRALFMEKGEIRFSGPTQDLLERPDVLRAVFLKGGAQDEGKRRTTGRSARATQTRKRQRREEILEQPVVLRTSGLSKHYGGITAVDAVDIELHEGEILGLIGPNGAGKTTIFDLISGFTPTDSGRIELMGIDVTPMSASARAKAGLGRSFQDARLWHSLTVKEAMAVACERFVDVRSTFPAMFGIPIVKESERDVDARVEELIRFLGLQAFRDKFVSELSTGSRRIVEIGAILAHRPTVLILDEPSSGIAQKETEQLGPLLRQVQDHLGCSMLIIEHDMPLITTVADRMYALDQGKVIAEGVPDDVTSHRLVVESYLGTEGYADLTGDDGSKPRRRRRKTTPKTHKRQATRKTASKRTTSRARES